jgi:hypothetical protein
MVERFQQRADIEFAPLQAEVILFHAPSNKFCVLNRTSSQPKRSRSEISDSCE